MKKAQLQHMFTFLLIGMVIVVVLFVGARFVSLLWDKGCDADLATFRRTLEDIERTYDTYGTRQEVTFSASCAIQGLCFFSQDTTRLEIQNQVPAPAISESAKQQLALAADLSSPKPNIFLVTKETVYEVGTFTKIVTKNAATEPLFCVQQQGGSFTMLVEGKGRTVEIS